MEILETVIVCKIKNLNVELQRIKDNSPPDYARYCVQYAGSGHYFKTKSDAANYLISRGFIKNAKEIPKFVKE